MTAARQLQPEPLAMGSGMTVSEAIEVLRAYNAWRRDNTGRVAFVDPVLIGQAIDLVCDAMTQDVAA